ncbi:MAG: hypothetical protein ACRDEA_21260, partial [Microcystaceae cyanobacterium]
MERLLGLVKFGLAFSGISVAVFLGVLSYQDNEQGDNSHSALVLAQQSPLNSEIPQEIFPCLPKQVQKLELEGYTHSGESAYYLIRISEIDQTGDIPISLYRSTLVELDNIGCKVV